MTAWLIVAVLLGQEEPLTPPPPPPVVPAEEPGRTPLPPQPVGEQPLPDLPPPPPVPPEEEAPPVDDSPGFGFRVSAAVGLALVGAGAMSVAMHFVGNCRATNPSDCVLLAMATLALGAGGVIAGALGGHRLMGGKSNLGWAFLGIGAGSAVGFVGYLIIGSLARISTSSALAPTIAVAGCAAIGAGFMLEIGHRLMVNELRLGVTPVVLRDGAGFALGGTF